MELNEHLQVEQVKHLLLHLEEQLQNQVISRFIHSTAVHKTLQYHRLHLTLQIMLLSISLSLVAVAVVDLEVV